MARLRTHNRRHLRKQLGPRAKGARHKKQFGKHPARLWTYHRLLNIHAGRRRRREAEDAD